MTAGAVTAQSFRGIAMSAEGMISLNPPPQIFRFLAPDPDISGRPKARDSKFGVHFD